MFDNNKMGKMQLTIFALALCFVACEVLADEDWWEHGHFYQIYPRSFQDSDGDGVGDLHGITVRLPYLKYIGVTGVWLSPIFQSPMKDFGYDISDFRQIHSEFGTLNDFDRLVERCKELDVKLILDFVPNHSSDKNLWFLASANPSHPDHDKYKDYYIWNEGKVLANGTRVPPSNWLSIFRRSAWTWVGSRKAYYYHQFLEEQPDLNYRSAALVNEMKEIMRFWLRKGVSGFRCDAVPFLFETEQNADGFYDDEPLSGECQDDPDAYCYLTHTKTMDLDETFDMIYQFRKVTEEDEFKDETR